MDCISAKQLAEDSKADAVKALTNILIERIIDRAKKGWRNVEVKDIVAEYNAAIVNDSYANLRSQGYGVNVIQHIINW